MIMFVAAAVIVPPVRVMVSMRMRRVECMHEFWFLFWALLSRFGSTATANVHSRRRKQFAQFRRVASRANGHCLGVELLQRIKLMATSVALVGENRHLFIVCYCVSTILPDFQLRFRFGR